MSTVTLERNTASPVGDRTRLPVRKLVIAAALLAAGAAGAYYGHDWWTTGRFVETTDDAYVGGNVTPISPHVAGFVANILVTDNQFVKAGQLLVQLDKRDVQAAYEHAQGVLDARVAALASLRAQYTVQQATIQQSAADQAAKSAHAQFARVDSARYAALAQTSFGTSQNAQRTQANAAEADAAVVASKAGLQASTQQLKILDAEVVQAQAVIVQAEADLATAKLNLEYTEIRSPIDGYVGNRAAQTGAFVGEGTYLLSIIPAHGLWVDANFKEDQLARMMPGQAATLVADVAPGTVIHGHVASLAPGTGAVFSVIPPENATGNFTKIVQRVPVRITIDADDPAAAKLRPGLSTTASVDTKAKP
jgi:membrane fusion protein (multidrug efflux system)